MKIIITESQYNRIFIKEDDFTNEYKRLYPKMFNQVCLRYADGDREKAQDFCQNGFIKVYHKMDQYDNTGSFEGWVRRIITNNILDELRKESRGWKKGSVDFSRTDVGSDEPYDELFMGRFSEQDIQDAVNSLPVNQREVFKLYYFDDLQHNEIADRLGITDGTSKSQLFKAKSKIKNYLENLKREV